MPSHGLLYPLHKYPPMDIHCTLNFTKVAKRVLKIWANQSTTQSGDGFSIVKLGAIKLYTNLFSFSFLSMQGFRRSSSNKGEIPLRVGARLKGLKIFRHH